MNSRMKSIIQDKKECYICGYQKGLHLHHIFNGNGIRNLADEDKMVAYLCTTRDVKVGQIKGKEIWKKTKGCHCLVHNSQELDEFLKRKGQEAWEKTYGTRNDFVERYGKSYL